MVSIPFHHDRPTMTWRARAYLAVTSWTHGCLAASIAFVPDLFTSASFNTVRAISGGNLEPWAWVYLAVASVSLYATISGSEAAARIGLTLSAMTLGFWAFSFLVGLFTGATGGPTAPIVWGTLVLKDLIVGAYPLTSPLEPLLRRVRRSTDVSTT